MRCLFWAGERTGPGSPSCGGEYPNMWLSGLKESGLPALVFSGGLRCNSYQLSQRPKESMGPKAFGKERYHDLLVL